MDTTFIYALNDPETGECRYIGKANVPHDRLFGPQGHLKNCHKKRHCACWIRGLLARELVPHLEILQEVPKSEWKLWERVWIKASRKIGMDLTNATPGGDGGSLPGEKSFNFGKKHSPERCAKIRAAKLGTKASPETRAKQSAARIGKKRSPELCKKMSLAMSGDKNPMFGKPGSFLGQKHSLETRAKMSDAWRLRRLKERS